MIKHCAVRCGQRNKTKQIECKGTEQMGWAKNACGMVAAIHTNNLSEIGIGNKQCVGDAGCVVQIDNARYTRRAVLDFAGKCPKLWRDKRVGKACVISTP